MASLLHLSALPSGHTTKGKHWHFRKRSFLTLLYLGQVLFPAAQTLIYGQPAPALCSVSINRWTAVVFLLLTFGESESGIGRLHPGTWLDIIRCNLIQLCPFKVISLQYPQLMKSSFTELNWSQCVSMETDHMIALGLWQWRDTKIQRPEISRTHRKVIVD